MEEPPRGDILAEHAFGLLQALGFRRGAGSAHRASFCGPNGLLALIDISPGKPILPAHAAHYLREFILEYPELLLSLALVGQPREQGD